MLSTDLLVVIKTLNARILFDIYSKQSVHLNIKIIF